MVECPPLPAIGDCIEANDCCTARLIWTDRGTASRWLQCGPGNYCLCDCAYDDYQYYVAVCPDVDPYCDPIVFPTIEWSNCEILQCEHQYPTCAPQEGEGVVCRTCDETGVS